ncbi:MAG: four helix bundle suffix domain-containing protein [Bacteroidales bacterium]|nr:four helix bundle suffix domain-containing protein [Candidatus Sodaliphilus limicaballi]
MATIFTTAASCPHAIQLYQKLEKDFVENGGIKERMYNARTGYRNTVVEQLKVEIIRLKSLLDSHGIKY